MTADGLEKLVKAATDGPWRKVREEADGILTSALVDHRHDFVRLIRAAEIHNCIEGQFPCPLCEALAPFKEK